MRQSFGDDLAYRGQGDGDLGERMALSIEEALGDGASSVVVIGTDCPGITSGLLERAFGLLREDPAFVIVGPALDGGYYLVGMSRAQPELFQGISWGTEHVLRQTEEAARRQGSALLLLEPLADVDRPEDLDVWYSARDDVSRARATPRLSVIIPALNEEVAISSAIDSAGAAKSVDIEVIVADGGSCDRTIEVAIARGARIVRGPAGRAIQMNAGAAVARGEILLFLHADTILPTGYNQEIAQALDRPETVAGAFRLKIAARSRSFRLIETLVHLLDRPPAALRRSGPVHDRRRLPASGRLSGDSRSWKTWS